MIYPIYSCLWTDTQAKPMAEYYCSVFKNASIKSENPFAVIFEINNTKFMALNGATKHEFSASNSYVIECDTQEDIDYYWHKLGEGGVHNKCGWLSDKFGVCWQIVPKILGELMRNPETAPKVMYAFMQMKKFDIETLITASK